VQGGSGIVIARYSGLTQLAYGGTVTDDGTNTIHTYLSSGDFYTGSPLATGGDIIDFQGYYFIHTFNSSGTFTPTQAFYADYLVVGGGAGGGVCSQVEAVAVVVEQVVCVQPLQQQVEEEV
jgi:hypothetical protein